MEIVLVNDNYAQKRKIVYQCTYCETKYVNRDNCPGCNASTAYSNILADNLDAVLTDEVKEESAKLVEKGVVNTYLIFTIIHLCSIAALVGFVVSPLMLLIHTIYHIAKRKKPHPVVIIDMGFCLLMTIIFIVALPSILS